MLSFVGVVCKSQNLNRVPTFRSVSYRMNTDWRIDLENNSIANIPDGAFSNLKRFGNGNNVSVFLGSNNLRSGNISELAFSGIENLVIVLGLERNHLTSLPKAVSRLTRLQSLNAQHNPIRYIDSSIFTAIHGTLETLKISLGAMPAWPTALRYITVLKDLVVDIGNGSIPANTFVKLYDTLRHLTIEKANLTQIPADVCNLGRLEQLDIYENRGLISGENVINCTSPLNATTRLYIHRSGFDQFPNIFEYFPNLELIYFNVSGIRFINDSLIPTGSRMTEFLCKTCRLRSVPAAINKFLLLFYCSLEDNLITRVERNSFDNLRDLRFISLSGNPIVFISRFAFRNLLALEALDLWKTKITTIPQAVLKLPNLVDLRLTSNISCTCGQIWMKQWASAVVATNADRFVALGGCHASNETLRDFIFNTLPQCS